MFVYACVCICIYVCTCRSSVKLLYPYLFGLRASLGTCVRMVEATARTHNCQSSMSTSYVHGHPDVPTVCGCVHAGVLPVRLLGVSSVFVGSDFKSGPKAQELS